MSHYGSKILTSYNHVNSSRVSSYTFSFHDYDELTKLLKSFLKVANVSSRFCMKLYSVVVMVR